jgi:vacuolar iron transporter family protein
MGAMADKNDLKRYRANYRAEAEAVRLYDALAKAEPNEYLAAVYAKLADTERRHVAVWEERLSASGAKSPRGRMGLRARVLLGRAKANGSASVVSAIAAIEAGAASGYDGQGEAEAVGMPGEERSHARVFGYLSKASGGMAGVEVARVEGRHKASGGNALRAGVLGSNDGLVSTFCLIMGVAGAGAAKKEILLTGGAGLLAGALSMALGEWLSVQSSRELYQRQIDIEKSELEDAPQEEVEELTLIYQAKGLDEQTARKLADKLVSEPASALDTLAREELSIDPKELGGSAWEAAFSSFFLFAAGAIIPIAPYLFLSGFAGIAVSAAVSALGLFGIGALITLMTGRHPLFSGMRQMLIGLAAAFVTFGVGRLVGIGLS